MVTTEPRCVNISVTLEMESLSASPGGGVPVVDILSYNRESGSQVKALILHNVLEFCQPQDSLLQGSILFC